MQTQVPLTAGELEMEMGLVEDIVGQFRARLPSMKSDPDWVSRWLRGQHIGEINAVASMRALRDVYESAGTGPRALRAVDAILRDEERHVELIEDLLRARGIAPRRPARETVLEGLEDEERGSVVASRAEAVRAGEIRAMLDDADVPNDVKETFAAILHDESSHERAFRRIAGDDAMKRHHDCSNWCSQDE